MAIRLDTSDPAFEAQFAAFLAAKRETAEDVEADVRKIIADVRARGDAALQDLSLKLDRIDLSRARIRVTAREIEEALHRHPAVVDCAVFGVPDERLGEQLKAVVELRPGDTATVDDLAAHCRGELADFKCPAVWEVVDELPRDPSGKVMKRFLREAHWAGRAANV